MDKQSSLNISALFKLHKITAVEHIRDVHECWYTIIAKIFENILLKIIKCEYILLLL